MSIICLICKEKLLNNAPGSPLGSLNSLIENQVIATGCGHLYHAECLQCWFKTQKKKLQNQGVTGILQDHCPNCQSEVYDEQIRRIHLLEDHREALEKAKLLEKMENLEIYCHQLEINIQQLQRENDMLLNKVLSPPTKSPLAKEEFAAIVKNDRVMWLKKDSTPLSGVVLSIFKKEGSLWVKLKLDKKIRTSQRSGLFGSFRFDKKQEWTVPFEDIVLEKDFKKNNIIDEDNVTSEPTTPTLFLPLQKVPSFRSSTMSLPGDYFGQNYSVMQVGKVQGLQPILSYDFINNFGSSLELPNQVNDQYMGRNEIASHENDSSPNIPTNDIPNPAHSSTNLPAGRKVSKEQRDYVVVNAKSPHPEAMLSNKINLEGRTSPQDGKGKHVTFADDLMKMKIHTSNPKSPKGNHFRDHDYNNVTEMPIQEQSQFENNENSNAEHIDITVPGSAEENKGLYEQEQYSSQLQVQSLAVPSIHLIQPSTSSTPGSSSLSIPGDMQMDVFIDSFVQLPQSNEQAKHFNSSCFDITFTALFYGCNAFDRVLLLRNAINDQIQQSVQHILVNGFVNPLRNSEMRQYSGGYSDRLYETISHLCSGCLDLEELMTILFEYVFKIPPFISYSYDMCDYIHQFFIDFTDKEKRPTVQQLFEQSLALQDNLKLRGEPSPALFLQMPNSEDGIIHYEFVLPSLTLNIEHVLENPDETLKTDKLTCYCNKTATLECAKCAEIHGKSPVLFCEDCSVLLDAIHNQMYHKLELSPIKAIKLPSVNLDLSAVICLKEGRYTAFLRSTNDDDGSQWVFIDDFQDGKPKVDKIPNMEKWIQSAVSDPSSLVMGNLTRYQRRLLTECRMFLYLPAHNSFA